MGLTTGQAVEVRFLEADPRGNCPLKGKRALIVLDVAARYAQARSKSEIRVRPVNTSLERLYREVYGFTLMNPKGQPAYFRKEV